MRRKIIDIIPFINQNYFILNNGLRLGNTSFLSTLRTFFIYSYYLFKLSLQFLWPFFIIGMFASFIEIKENKYKLIIPVWFLFIFLIYINLGYNAPRNIVSLLPSVALLSAYGISILIKYLSSLNFYKKYKINSKYLFILVIGVISFLGLISILPYLDTTFHTYAESAVYLQEVNATRVFSYNSPLTGWYFQGKVVILNVSELDKGKILSQNISHILIDTSSMDKDNKFLLEVQQKCSSVKTIPIEKEKWRFITPDDWEYNFSLFFINKISKKIGESLEKSLKFRMRDEFVRIYDVNKCEFFRK